MTSRGLRVYPLEMETTSNAIISSGFGGVGMSHVQNSQQSPISQITKSMSLEEAYWSGMRKRVGLSGLQTVHKKPDNEYEMIRKDMAVYVETHFHQKECIYFVPKPNQKVKAIRDLKCHCGEILSQHVWGRSGRQSLTPYVPRELLDIVRAPTERPPETLPSVEWIAGKCLEKAPTTTYGKMNFNMEVIGGKKPAKFLRLCNEDSVDACFELMKKYWRIMEPHQPNLVISVVGGAKNFRLDGDMRDTFSHGLIKAAKTTNAWLITSGFNMGVMKAVGQAVCEGQAFLWDNDRMTHILRCIAIAPWGYVYGRRFLEGKDSMGKFDAYYRTSNQILHGQPVPLNPDHTHFIFVDDGFRNRYGGVNDFRAKFEKKLYAPKEKKGYGIPVVMVVLEGGPDAIQDVSQSLKEGIPVVVCTGTGRAADILTYAHNFTFLDRNDGGRKMNDKHRKILEGRVMAAYSKNWGTNASNELTKIMATIDTCMEQDHLMIFFDLRKDEDLDVAILSVLTKAESRSGDNHRIKQLDLALTWNRADIAQSEIFREDVNWKTEELYIFMRKALLEDKMDFVRLLLNQGMSMKEFLTVVELEDLYNKIPKIHFVPMILKRHCQKDDFCLEDIAKFLVKLLDRYDDEIASPKKKIKNSQEKRGTERSKKNQFSYSRHRFIETTDTEPEDEPLQFKRPYKQLLLWAVMHNRPLLAQFFWEMGEEPITSALTCSLLCVGMHRLVPKYLSTIREDFLRMKTKFELLATKVLDECHSSDPNKAIMLLDRKSPTWSQMTCLQIAAAANDQAFVSSVACQNSVNNVWKSGIMSDWRRVFFATLIPFLIIPLIHIVDMGNRKLDNCQKLLTFFTAPITSFSYYTFSYMIFLALYTYMLLVDFGKQPSTLEIILMVWIFTIFVNEVHTLLVFPSPTFKGKLRDWFTFLNRLEMASLVLAFVGFFLRINSGYFMHAKTIYCINIVIFYVRILSFYTANSHLGPKLYMIIRMVEELIMFLLVLVVFLLAYGVSSQGLLYRVRNPNWVIVRDIIYFPYWILYGELFLDEIQSDDPCMNVLSNGTSIEPYENTCRTSYWLVPILLGLYLLVGNVLLLNLLVAIFSHVFDMVEQNSIQIWKFQMYFLVMEFQCKAKIVPPFSIILHIIFFIKWILRSTCCKKIHTSQQFQQHHLMYLALFEKEMMANYLRRMKSESMDSMNMKFIKLQMRLDILTKQIEERHVENEMSIESTLLHSDSFIQPQISHYEKSVMPIPGSKITFEKMEMPKAVVTFPTVVPATFISTDKEIMEENKTEKKDDNIETLDSTKEVEEHKKKHKKKKKKKDKHSKSSKSRDSGLDQKELNINIPSTDTKPFLQKNLSDDDNAVPEYGTSAKRMVNPAARFSFPAPTPTIHPAPQVMAVLDLSHMSDADESEQESQMAATRVVRHRKSQGSLNRLSQSDHKVKDDASSSGNEGRHRYQRSHNRPRKDKHRHTQAYFSRTESDGDMSV